MLKNTFIMTSLSLGLMACMATANTPLNLFEVQQRDGSPVLAAASIGEEQAAVLVKANNELGTEPTCERRKVALNNTKRAFFYEICSFEVKDRAVADIDAPVNEIVYHFVDMALVRVDVVADGDATVQSKVKEQIIEAFGADNAVEDQAAERSSATASTSTIIWENEQQAVSMRLGESATAGQIFLRLYDADLAKTAAWLAED